MIRQAPKRARHVFAAYAAFVLTFSAACSTPLTTREKGAGIGALGGAPAGGIIGSAVGHPGAGAAIGGTLGLGTGALIGDQLQGQEQKQQEQQGRIEEQRSQIAKNQVLIEELRRRNIEARETDRGVAVNLPSVDFQFDSAELTPEGGDRVNQTAAVFKNQGPGRKVSVEGHASLERPDQEAYNQKLSERRAPTAAGALGGNGGWPSPNTTPGRGP